MRKALEHWLPKSLSMTAEWSVEASGRFGINGVAVPLPEGNGWERHPGSLSLKAEFLANSDASWLH